MTDTAQPSEKITCKTCGREDVPNWNGLGQCIGCARDAVLGTDRLGALRRDIVVELTNHYHETYRYDRPNDTVEQLATFCRDIAENEVSELLTAHTNSLLAEIEGELKDPANYSNGYLDGPYCEDIEIILDAHRVKA